MDVARASRKLCDAESRVFALADLRPACTQEIPCQCACPGPRRPLPGSLSDAFPATQHVSKVARRWTLLPSLVERDRLSQSRQLPETQSTSRADAERATLDALAPYPDAQDESGASSVDERGEVARAAFEEAIAQVEPRTRDAMRRVLMGTEPVVLVAGDLGMTPNAIYVAKSRVLARIRAILGELGESIATMDDRRDHPAEINHRTLPTTRQCRAQNALTPRSCVDSTWAS